MKLVNIYKTILSVVFVTSITCTLKYFLEYKEAYNFSDKQYSHSDKQYSHSDKQHSHSEQQYSHSDNQHSHSEHQYSDTSHSYNLSWKWINTPEQNFHILVSSVAYYDDRDPFTSFLRLHWIFSRNIPTLFWENLRFIVKLESKGQWYKEMVVTEPIVHKHKVMPRKIGDIRHSQFMMSLPLGSVNYVPHGLLLFSIGFTKVNHTITVIQPSIDQPVQFSVCVKSMYGEINDRQIPRLVEWIEMNKLLGVFEFHFYNASLTNNKHISSLLQYYKKDIFLHQVGANFTYEINDTINTYRNEEFQAAEVLSRAVYSDCIYRNYKRVKHLLLIDMDELIIPRQHMNYSSLVSSLSLISSEYNSAASISFDMAMFYSQFGKDEDQPEYLHTLQYRKQISYHKTRGIMSLIRKKSFINPKTCVIAFHHFCLEQISDKVNKIMFVPKELGLLHHYRESVAWEKNSNFEKPVQDDIMFKYKTKLEISVSTALKKLYHK